MITRTLAFIRRGLLFTAALAMVGLGAACTKPDAAPDPAPTRGTTVGRCQNVIRGSDPTSFDEQLELRYQLCTAGFNVIAVSYQDDEKVFVATVIFPECTGKPSRFSITGIVALGGRLGLKVIDAGPGDKSSGNVAIQDKWVHLTAPPKPHQAYQVRQYRLCA